MLRMGSVPILKVIASVWLVWAGQVGAPPAYVVEGDRVEAGFRVHRDNLERFFVSLRDTVARRAPELLTEFQDPPPEPVVFGYGLLPEIVDVFPVADDTPVSSFSYSWPITEGYVEGEIQKLRQVNENFLAIVDTITTALIGEFIDEYRTLVRNQRTVDGYIQYNRFWQRAISRDRPRFDQLTTLYELVMSGDPATAEAIQEVLGVPQVPSFVRIEPGPGEGVVLHVPVYTDIEDRTFLRRAEAAIEETWRVEDDGRRFEFDIEIRQVGLDDLYPETTAPIPGEPIDIQDHGARFPEDGALLMTGAEATHGFVGRYVALGPGDISVRTLAHEFGHVLGFRDGYIRGYRDLGDRGFEILERTSAFDDIMSAPRRGRVLATHFRLIMDALR